MTDFGPWEKLIAQSPILEYKLAPLSQYQIINLLGALVRAPHTNLGDFYWGILSVLGTMVERFEIDEMNNFGDQINKEYVAKLYRGQIHHSNCQDECDETKTELEALKAENKRLHRAIINLGGNL